MIEYWTRYHDKLLVALVEHLELVAISLLISLLLAAALTLLCMLSRAVEKVTVSLFSLLYAIPSLAMFALLIPLTGLGKVTAVCVLVIYNQYLLLRNFITGLSGVDPALTNAALGMGMTKVQVLLKIRLPLSRRALMTGVRLAVVSTIGIATIAASINAGGLGAILFDGLCVYNIHKIIWGSLLAAGLAIDANGLLSLAEKRLDRR